MVHDFNEGTVVLMSVDYSDVEYIQYSEGGF